MIKQTEQQSTKRNLIFVSLCIWFAPFIAVSLLFCLSLFIFFCFSFSPLHSVYLYLPLSLFIAFLRSLFHSFSLSLSLSWSRSLSLSLSFSLDLLISLSLSLSLPQVEGLCKSSERPSKTFKRSLQGILNASCEPCGHTSHTCHRLQEKNNMCPHNLYSTEGLVRECVCESADLYFHIAQIYGILVSISPRVPWLHQKTDIFLTGLSMPLALRVHIIGYMFGPVLVPFRDLFWALNRLPNK